MEFNGFEQHDFETFNIEGLEKRMEAIRSRIQPKFQAIGEDLVDYLSMKLNQEMFIHIARHARRTVNPPNDTWIAFSSNKRGYKMLPHFQVGLWDDRLFVWLAYIYELPNKLDFAQVFINQEIKLKQLIPNDYDISMNHMKKSNEHLADINLTERLQRFKDVKSAELLIGKQFDMHDPVLKDGTLLLQTIKSIFDTLVPIYQLSLQKSI